MEELLAKHRKELRDLVARASQRKKGATKKTRRGIFEECANMERELKERQQQEIMELTGESGLVDQVEEKQEQETDQETENQVPETQANGRSSPNSAYLISSVQDFTITGSKVQLPPATPPELPQPRGKKQNRQKARLARRAAEREAQAIAATEEARNLPDLRTIEREQLASWMTSHGFREKEIRADGHCLYSAIADQMEVLGLDLKPTIKPPGLGDKDEENSKAPYRKVREAAASYIASHANDFAPFLEEPLNEYITKIRDSGEWGGELELLALAKAYGIRISVVQASPTGGGSVHLVDPKENGRISPESLSSSKEQKSQNKEIWLSYHRHGFGLGEHYNSLRKV